ncbi:MAG: flagellar basal body rod C-terminal domain-containing protein [Rubricella sp.]
MSDLGQAMAVSSSGLAAQSARLRVTAENIANTDTPGYRSKALRFGIAGHGGVETGGVALSAAPLRRVHDPSHPLAGADGGYDGSNVNLMLELANAREAQRSYEANLRLFDQARQMASSLTDLLRR